MVKIAIVGCGYWGPNLIRNFHEVPDASVVACCDTNPERLRYINKRFPHLSLYSNLDDVIKNSNIDAVSIATPVATHYQIAKDAMLNGKHVLIEKPITKTSREAETLLEIAAQNKRVLMVGHTFEYTGSVNKIKEIIENGGIGKLYYFDSSRVNLGLFRNDINVIWDLASHDISIMFYLIGDLPIAVNAVGGSFVTENEDVAYIILKFSDNKIAHFHVSWLAPVKYRRIVIGGSEKMIVYDDVENIEKVKVFDKGVSISGTTEGILERQLIYRTGDIISPKVDTAEPLKVECSHFIECIKNNVTPRSDGMSGFRVVKILEAAQESLMNSGRTVEVNFD